jgi:catechol 2,3-dioxygenase-like lactoylglutathione lyase family enzyme
MSAGTHAVTWRTQATTHRVESGESGAGWCGAVRVDRATPAVTTGDVKSSAWRRLYPTGMVGVYSRPPTLNGFRTTNRTGTLLYSLRNPIRKGSNEMGLSIKSVTPTIAVEDLDRAISFYSDKLGLTVRRLEGDMASALVEIGASDRLLLYKSSYPRGETTYCSFLTDDVEGSVRELRDRGVKFEEYDFPGLKTVGGIATTEGGLKTGWFRDSEGNILAISNEVPEIMRKAA